MSVAILSTGSTSQSRLVPVYRPNFRNCALAVIGREPLGATALEQCSAKLRERSGFAPYLPVASTTFPSRYRLLHLVQSPLVKYAIAHDSQGRSLSMAFNSRFACNAAVS